MSRIVFIHPDLGIGGAERLVVDAALALKSKGHNVNLLTSHHDPGHCFVETRDGTLPVTVVGDWLPRKICGRFYAFCAYIRMIYVALYLVLYGKLKPDIVFCDLVSVCIPILRVSGARVVFYCHFPDQLLSKKGGVLKSLYRAVLDRMEEYTTGKADKILVNSKFTSQVFRATFSRLHVIPDVLYPSINTTFFDQDIEGDKLEDVLNKKLLPDTVVFLSINRYERKKNLNLALLAMSRLEESLASEEWKCVHFVMAGGYDPRVVENVGHFEELVEEAKNLGIEKNVTFLRSPSDTQKLTLLRSCHALVYTPSEEHFGIVPLEAMYMEKPVIAANSGGPKETVVNGETGFLCNDVKEFSAAMLECVRNQNGVRKRLGQAGKVRVKNNFSFEAFADQLESVVQKLVASHITR